MHAIDQTTFQQEVQEVGERLSLARANLLFAREIAYPNLRLNDYLTQLDSLAERAAPTINRHATLEAKGQALAAWLGAQGFRGNQTDYTDARNSYLNKVLDSKLGLPISLSAIYLEVGERLGLPVLGIGMPGHYIVSIEAEDGAVYFDPFHSGQRLTMSDCLSLVKRASGYNGAFNPRWLLPTSPRDTVARMLNNLRNHYTQVEHWELAIRVTERLMELETGVAGHTRDLGILHFRAGSLRQAAEWLSLYLARAPNATDADTVRESRDAMLDQVVKWN